MCVECEVTHNTVLIKQNTQSMNMQAVLSAHGRIAPERGAALRAIICALVVAPWMNACLQATTPPGHSHYQDELWTPAVAAVVKRIHGMVFSR